MSGTKNVAALHHKLPLEAYILCHILLQTSSIIPRELLNSREATVVKLETVPQQVDLVQECLIGICNQTCQHLDVSCRGSDLLPECIGPPFCRQF